MDILVDYDNVERRSKKAGIVAFCTNLVDAIAAKKITLPDHCRIRLYGGWYENTSLTHKAQELIAEIAEHYPGTISWSNRHNSGQCRVKVEMAYSLEVEPARRLFYTYRTRDFSEHLQCNNNRLETCSHSPCLLRTVADFFRDKKCPQVGCYTTPGDLLRKSEQKLVDTMLTADIIFLAKGSNSELVVVSSDDDLWPGIQTALLFGARVLHVHTCPKAEPPTGYTSGLTQYKKTTL